MIERWHNHFSPNLFLSRVNIDRFIEQNEAYKENKVEKLWKPCILCGSNQGPGLLLNDKSYLCKSCFNDASKIKYPEKYEGLHRQYLKDREAINQARTSLIDNCMFRRVSLYASIAIWAAFPLLYFSYFVLVIPIVLFLIYLFARNKHVERVAEWDSLYPCPQEPQLKHFHDPTAELTFRDRAILKVFNNWPGYPPFWSYLREIILTRDQNHCQVSGCPSRVELHIHHKTPVAQGGEHVPTNLVTLCSFHHALEPEEGHERIWGDIKSRYFTMVCAHIRRNSSSPGYHSVRAHVRRLELVEKAELLVIKDYYGLACPSCDNKVLQLTIDKEHQQVHVGCSNCGVKWFGARELSEETGPRLCEALKITKNKGCWQPRWDMLEVRGDSTFRLLKKSDSRSSSTHSTIKTLKNITPICPKCGSKMSLIRPRQNDQWKAFWGCSKYKITGCKGSLDV